MRSFDNSNLRKSTRISESDFSTSEHWQRKASLALAKHYFKASFPIIINIKKLNY